MTAQLAPDVTELSDDTLVEMQRRMLRIRRFDERASKMVKRGAIPGTVHTSIGQEAQVVGACMALGDQDYMTGNHRSHGHPIGKGAPLGPLMAELVGKSGGVCHGKGGSLHLSNFEVGSLGESGIVGGSIPIAVGAGLSSKVLDNGRVALAFFGDGAANQGNLYEGLNMSGVWKLPVIFLCENNQYALSTPAHTVTSGVIADRAAGFRHARGPGRERPGRARGLRGRQRSGRAGPGRRRSEPRRGRHLPLQRALRRPQARRRLPQLRREGGVARQGPDRAVPGGADPPRHPHRGVRRRARGGGAPGGRRGGRVHRRQPLPRPVGRLRRPLHRQRLRHS